MKSHRENLDTAMAREIPTSNWGAFLRTFSERYRGRTVSVEPADEQNVGATRAFGFERISAQAAADGRTVISLLLRTSPEALLRRTIAGPARIRVLTGTEGGRPELQIQPERGASMLLRFQPDV